METLINWESLGAFGVVLVVLVLLVRSIILGVLKNITERESRILDREDKSLEREERLLDIMKQTSGIMRQTTESIGVHTETMKEVQRTMISEREAITKQIRRSEANIKRAINKSSTKNDLL